VPEPIAHASDDALFAAARARVARFEAGECSARDLRDWLLHRGAGRPAILQRLAMRIEALRERGRLQDGGWQEMLSALDELIDELTSTEPGGTTHHPTPPPPAPGASGATAARAAGAPASAGTTDRETAIPERIAGRYRLQTLIHDGARSRIWRATDESAAAATPGNGAPDAAVVAVKLVDASRTGCQEPGSPQALEAASGHPHLVRLLETGRAGRWRYQVLGWVPGSTLEYLLTARGSVPGMLIDAPSWIAQLAQALDVLHAAGFVHGDVAPANVMITPEGEAVLLDLEMMPRGAQRPADGSGLTRAFASPQALTGGAADTRDDIFSLGALAFRLLAGYLPHGREGSASMGHPLPPPERPAELGELQWQALAAALHPRAERRPATAGEFAAALAQTARPRPNPTPPSRPTRRAAWP